MIEHTPTLVKTLSLVPGWVKMGSLFLYTFCLKIAAFMTGSPSINILFGFFVFMMFLPEIAMLFSKSFRQWIKSGIEDSDGQFNSKDLANLLVHYSTLWCARLYVFFGLLEAFYGIKVREMYVMGSLAGAFGIEALGFFTSKFKKEEK